MTYPNNSEHKNYLWPNNQFKLTNNINQWLNDEKMGCNWREMGLNNELQKISQIEYFLSFLAINYFCNSNGGKAFI